LKDVAMAALLGLLEATNTFIKNLQEAGANNGAVNT
jgi:hypothetical protein